MVSTTKSQHEDRVIDFVMVALFAILFLEGYHSAELPRWHSRGRGVAPPLLILGSFIAVFYPFRLHTRLFWILLQPFAFLIVPILGHDVCMRLTRAPGLESRSMLSGMVLLEYSVFIAALVAWSIPDLCGLRLHRGSQTESVGRSAKLYELLSINCIFCLLLVLFRDSFQVQDLRWFPSFHELLHTVFLRVLFFGSVILGGFLWGWRGILVAIPIGLTCGWGVECYDRYSYWTNYNYVEMPGLFDSYKQFATRHLWQLGLLVAVILIARGCGFRLAGNRLPQPSARQ